MIHEINVRTAPFDRIESGQITAKVVADDVDYQAGDELHFYELNSWGNRKYHYVDRDEKGRFASQNVEDPPVRTQITHAMPAAHCDGLVSGKMLLSFVLLED